MGHVAVPPPPAPIGRIHFEEEMRTSYINYAMSVIVSRALPDVRDGLKPVHRRILYGAHDGKYTSANRLVKSARIVGDVMGKFHPHGDSAIYDAMVRLAQPFSVRLPLIEGQGNFGSPDGDSPAAMRYTEARLARVSDEGMLADIDEDTVGWRPTYDSSQEEPTVLPARFPNLLVNGGEGIAVGMATKIPPHNLGEVIDATLAVMADPFIATEDLMRIIPGPDFPTGAVIQGRGAIRMAFDTGRGSLTMASVHVVEQIRGGRQAIVITELPYQVNKSKLIETIADLVNKKEIEGIADLRDESTGTVRVVIELKRDANIELVLNKLRKMTDFVKTFGVNATCLDPAGNPKVMGLREILSEFVAFRRFTISRRTRFRLEKARARLVTQIGFFAARTRIDEVVRIIRAASDGDAARAALMRMEFPTEGELAVLLAEADPDMPPEAGFRLSEAQARSILDLRLAKLTSMEQEAIAAEARAMLATMRSLVEILRDDSIRDAVMRQELAEIRAKFATPRLTRIESAGPSDIDDDDLIEDKQVVLTLTRQGYVKITDLSAYREQSRGGKGRTGMETKDDDIVTQSLVCSTRTKLVFFTSRGIAHTVKAYRLPNVAANAKGRPIQNFGLTLREGETIATVMPMPAPGTSEGRFMVFATDGGTVRRNAVSDFERVQSGGKVAMKLEDENGVPTARLIAVLECGEDDDVILATRSGKAARFPVTEIRVFKGRDSTGNAGIDLASGDTVIGACIVRHFDATPQEREAYFNDGTVTWTDDDGKERSLTLVAARMAEMKAAEQTLLTVTALGYGKRFSTHDFRATGRNAKGVWVGSFGEASGDLVSLVPVEGEDGIVLMTDGGQAIRTRCSEVRVMGRATRGVRLFDLPEGQTIVDVARVGADD